MIVINSRDLEYRTPTRRNRVTRSWYEKQKKKKPLPPRHLLLPRGPPPAPSSRDTTVRVSLALNAAVVFPATLEPCNMYRYTVVRREALVRINDTRVYRVYTTSVSCKHTPTYTDETIKIYDSRKVNSQTAKLTASTHRSRPTNTMVMMMIMTILIIIIIITETILA